MRLPFKADYQYRLTAHKRARVLIILGWLALATAVCLLVVPQVRYYLELAHLARTVDSRVAVAEETRPSVSGAFQPEGSAAAAVVAESGFSSGAGIEAVIDTCAAEGVAIIGYRPLRQDRNSPVCTEALELKLDGPYPGVKAVLQWLESGPFQAEVRHFEVAAREGQVLATVQAVQLVESAMYAEDAGPFFEGRSDVFSSRRSETSGGEENKSMQREAN